MRLVLWLVALAGIAVAVALFAGHNEASVTLFWPPYRVDLSLNLVILVLVLCFVLGHAVLRALAALFALPQQAAQWRNSQRQRALHLALVDALVQVAAGRFTRARKAAQVVLDHTQALSPSEVGGADLRAIRAVGLLLQAEAAHSLRDRSHRNELLVQLLESTRSAGLSDVRDAALMRAARWDLDERDAAASIDRLDAMSQGAGRRALALKIRLKAQRLAQRPRLALDTARLLIKHHAYSELAAASLTRGLVAECVAGARDCAQLMDLWNGLSAAERSLPDGQVGVAERWLSLGGDATQARSWLMPLWDRWTQLSDSERARLVNVFEQALEGLDTPSLAKLEAVQRGVPGEPLLQYLCGMAFKQLELWGKAQAMLSQSLRHPLPPGMARRAWLGLAELASARGDETAEREAWRGAARVDR